MKWIMVTATVLALSAILTGAWFIATLENPQLWHAISFVGGFVLILIAFYIQDKIQAKKEKK